MVCFINIPFSGKPAAKTPEAKATESSIDRRSFLTEEILMSNSSAKMAELVAKEIYSIRESKNALLRGEEDNMPKDGAQLKLMLHPEPAGNGYDGNVLGENKERTQDIHHPADA